MTDSNFKATAADVALCVRAHLADGDQDAANELVCWYLYGPKNERGHHIRFHACHSANVRRGLLFKLGVSYKGLDWGLRTSR